MPHLLLFVTSCVIAGLGAALGSILGHAAGPSGLRAGGVIGGLFGCGVAAGIGILFSWITRAQYWPTAIGAMVGFLAAAFVALHTLSSPVGPVLSTLLIGAGALAGARMRGKHRSGIDR